MKTPIVDFVKKYSHSHAARFHMPGHKGKPMLGCESLDITEISGADCLYSADGVILESEDNATELFGTAHSFYSAEGSTLTIKAMLALVTEDARARGERALVIAARNAHKAFINACALLDIDVKWIYPADDEHMCECHITSADVEKAIADCERAPSAVYLTSPDYLGNICDIKSISNVCQNHGTPLCVDNAHGAYLKFLDVSAHPIDLGADLVCDSAHKTLPVLTGGAYLHVSKNATKYLERARDYLSLFASTSPSYLILESLDLCNKYLADEYRGELSEFIKKFDTLKATAAVLGFKALENEPLKLVIDASASGYTGTKLAELLRAKDIESEFSDNQYLVLMATPQNTTADIEKLIAALSAIEHCAPITSTPPKYPRAEQVMSIREAMLSPAETVRVEDASGRICGTPAVSCPPAVPIIVSGERVTDEVIDLLKFYGTEYIKVIK